MNSNHGRANDAVLHPSRCYHVLNDFWSSLTNHYYLSPIPYLPNLRDMVPACHSLQTV